MSLRVRHIRREDPLYLLVVITVVHEHGAEKSCSSWRMSVTQSVTSMDHDIQESLSIGQMIM
jgi:hypothetical protein